MRKHLNQFILCSLLAVHFTQLGTFYTTSTSKELPTSFLAFSISQIFDNLFELFQSIDNSNAQNSSQHHIEHAGIDTFFDVFEDEIDETFIPLWHQTAEHTFTVTYYKNTYCEHPHPELSSPPPQFS